MANGPPTPPPTTATELQDETRVSTIQEASEPALGVETHDAYRHIFPIITELVSQSKFQDLIQTAENSDLHGDGDRQITRLLVTAPLVLAYLVLDNVPPARYTLTRLPDNLTSTPLVKSLMGLVASTWDRKYESVYSRAENLFNLVAQPDFFDANLAAVIRTMTTTFVESFRQRTFVLLSKAYISLPMSLARSYLGMTTDQMITAAEQARWTYDATSDTLSPSPPSPAVLSIQNPSFSSLSTFNFVADSVAKLES